MPRGKRNESESEFKSTKKNGSTPKADRPTARTLSDLTEDQRKVLFFNHLRQFEASTLAETAAKDATKKVVKLAKAEGFSKKELELAVALKSAEGEAKLKGEVETRMRLARWMGAGLGTQGDLFVGEPAMDRHFEDGKRAALQDELRKPPSDLAQAEADRWLSGHATGTQIRNETLAANFKPLGDAVKPGPEAATIGDAPASFTRQ